jgi:hypothetical protein
MNEAPMGPEALAAILQREYTAADSYRDILAQLELQAFQYYEGRPFGNEVEGRSQVVLPDVQETIDYMAASVLRTFVSGERTVEFEATDEGDEEGAQEATAAVNYSFMRKQDGYRILHDGCVDGLLRKIGIFKTCYETVETVTKSRVRIDEQTIADMQDMDLEGIEVEDVSDDGEVTVKRTRKEKRFTDFAIAPANFRFSPKAPHEDDADYLCHADPEKTRSDLVEMGFDKDQVYSLPGYSSFTSFTVESGRLDQTLDEESSKALEKVLLCEEYARIDMDGDGIAERVKVYRVDNQILIDAETGKPSIETVEDQPFSVFCPFPRPHRLVGYSLADKVLDIQLARSFVARQLFDGLALSNMPRPIVDSLMADADTYSDILNPIPGSPIRVKGGPNSVQAMSNGFDIGKSMTAMEWLVGERESRTGITRLNQGLDADALNKTATGTALLQSQGQQQEEFIARNLAETLSRLFLKKYRLMRAEGVPFKVKVDGQYKEVDPSQWPEEVNMVVRVGLGSNSKDKRIQARMLLANLMAQGTEIGDVEPRHRFKMIDGLVRDMGIGQGDDYWTDPDAPPEVGPDGQPVQKAEKPDPEAMKLQAEMQMQQAKLQGEQQLSQARLASEHELAQTRLQLLEAEGAAKQELARDQAEHTAALAEAKAQRESELAQQKMAMEQELAQQRMVMEAQMNEHKAHLAQQSTDAKLSQNRPGGKLDA